MANNKLIIRHFSPAWFAASMGTGGMANLFYLLSNSYQWLKTVAYALFAINAVMFIVFLIPWILRWFLHFEHLNKDIKHPMMSNFFVTMPVAAMILAMNVLAMGQGIFSLSFTMNFGLFFWFFGIVLSLGLSVYVSYNMMVSESIHPDITNFSWFITPVASIIIPLLGNSLVKYYVGTHPEFAAFINLMDLSFYGIGFILFIILSGILINRFFLHKMPPSMMLPTFWIILGPIGIGVVALMSVADINVMLGYISSAGTLKILALILWGFGFWAFGLILLVSVKYLKNGKIPFSLSWWAFIFPLVAYGLSGISVYQYTQIQFVFIYTLIVTGLLLLLWILTFIKSVIGVIDKSLLIPKK